MARYRIAEPARADLAAILATSRDRHGEAGRVRYRALVSAAMRHVARDPEGAGTTDRGLVASGMRSFHIGHCRDDTGAQPVRAPVRALFYRVVAPGLVEIVRVLHERMDFAARLEAGR